MRRFSGQKETRRSRGSRAGAFRIFAAVTGSLHARIDSVLLGDAHQTLLDVPAALAQTRADPFELRHLGRLEGKSVRLQRILGAVDEPATELGMLDRPADDGPDHLITHQC